MGETVGEIKEKIAPPPKKKYTTVNNLTTIVLKYSAVTLHSSELVFVGWKERNIAGNSGGGGRLQRSVMFRADFNGWAGERSCGDIHIMKTQRNFIKDKKN